MECHSGRIPGDDAYLSRLDEKIERLRIPVSGTVDLTHRCNLDCVHCYLDNGADSVASRRELDTGQWLRIIDDITAAGCLYLLVSGGEPLLRKDFPRIYRRMKESGLVITLFSNGTCLTDELISLFDDLPPHAVEITLYGASGTTYEKITGSKAAFKNCLRGIEALLTHNINVSLKTVLMTLNRHEFAAIKQLADGFGVDFRFDAAIFPGLSGDRTPLLFRVSPEEAVARELADPDMADDWRTYYEQRRYAPASGELYQCDTGLTSFYIDPCGWLQPCLMVREPKYDLLTGRFLSGWQTVIPAVRKIRADRSFACNRCDKAVLCGVCPGFFKLETGFEQRPSGFLCAMGHERFKALGYKDSGGG